MATTRLKRGSPYRVPSQPLGGQGDGDPALTFGASVLLPTSALRLIRPVLGAEAFGVEPTLALFAALVSGAYLLGLLWAWLGRLRDP